MLQEYAGCEETLIKKYGPEPLETDKRAAAGVVFGHVFYRHVTGTRQWARRQCINRLVRLGQQASVL
ncbi:hypothetical protein DIPPA_30430 [Diplonema papillatum]|nr:hypothetical protein DIPPA_30430 [Diplonema papillatum]